VEQAEAALDRAQGGADQARRTGGPARGVRPGDRRDPGRAPHRHDGATSDRRKLPSSGRRPPFSPAATKPRTLGPQFDPAPGRPDHRPPGGLRLRPDRRGRHGVRAREVSQPLARRRSRRGRHLGGRARHRRPRHRGARPRGARA
jgi:hypothetical protein